MAVVSSSKISLPIFIVDAFSSRPFEGNPAAVCLVDDEVLSDAQKQKIASEMNLSETAFVSPVKPSDNFKTGSNFNLCWFTPTNEVNLCGHATMATSAVLFTRSGNTNEVLTFQTKSGALSVRKEEDGFVMDFPRNYTHPEDPTSVSELLKIVIGDLKYAQVEISEKTTKLLVRLQDSETRASLESLNPDTDAMMRAYSDGRIKGVIVTLKGCPQNGAQDEVGETYDFMSRYFAPWNGIPEDPVTGSAHTVLGSYWSQELNKTTLYARQCSPRGGELRVTVSQHRVNLSGNAVVVVEGKIFI